MKGLFILHVTLAALWLVLTESYSAPNFLFGLFVSYLVVVLFAHSTGNRHYTTMIRRVIGFLGYFVYILTKANIDVAKEVITPGHSMTPRIVRYDVADLTDIQTTTLATAITLTPGTLSADVSDDGDTLYIHCMYAKDRDAAIAELDELKHNLLTGLFGKNAD